MKILFFINALEHGGAARVITTLGNELASRSYTVFIMANTVSQKVNFKIDDNVHLIPIFTEKSLKYPGAFRKIHNFFRIRGQLKKVTPDIIIGVMPRNFLKILICSLGLSIPLIASDHTSFNRKLDLLSNFIRFHLYNLANAITILTLADYKFLGERLPKKVIMPNPLTYDIFAGQSTKRKNLLAVGRLDEWWIKGFDILIEVWARIAKKYPDWILEFVGDGRSESFRILQNFVSKYEIDEYVKFLGYYTNMEKIFQNSSIFILSSRYEGFGMVLIEAMSQGCACISFDNAGRQEEIISSQENGIIIKGQSKDRLENAIIRLIEDDVLRASLGEHAKQEVTRYSKGRIAEQWEKLFSETITK